MLHSGSLLSHELQLFLLTFFGRLEEAELLQLLKTRLNLHLSHLLLHVVAIIVEADLVPKLIVLVFQQLAALLQRQRHVAVRVPFRVEATGLQICSFVFHLDRGDFAWG